MTTAPQIAEGVWYRFDAYEVVDGYVRPKPGADGPKLYHPWQDYEAAMKGGRQLATGKKMIEPPYQSLLNLCDEVGEQHRAPLASWDDRKRSLIADWCAMHGLLGILPQSVFTIVLAPRWRSPSEDSGLLFPTVDQHVRTSSEWRTVHTRYLRPSRAGEGRKLNQLVSGEIVPDEAPKPHAISQQNLVGNPKIQRDSLWKSVSHFFPEVPEPQAETYDYPRPFSERFWQLYAEPLDKFMAFAFGFSDAVQTITRLKGTRISKLGQDNRAYYADALYTIEALMANVRHTIGFTEDDQLVQRWTSASLLASFGMMAFLDLAEGKVHRCANETCGRIFVTDAWQAAYCSPRCRNTALKRESRKRVGARQMRAEGKSFQQIAKRFGVDVKKVKEWTRK